MSNSGALVCIVGVISVFIVCIGGVIIVYIVCIVGVITVYIVCIVGVIIVYIVCIVGVITVHIRSMYGSWIIKSFARFLTKLEGKKTALTSVAFQCTIHSELLVTPLG